MQVVLCHGSVVSLLDTRPIPTSECKMVELLEHISRLARYNGGARGYSVAQHSWLVSMLTNSLDGLLHDLHEAIIGDLGTPIKEVINHFSNNAWTAFEDKIQTRVRRRFGLNSAVTENTHKADLLARRIEVASLFPPQAQKRFATRGVEPLHGHPLHIHDVWPQKKAFDMFMERYKVLGAGIQ